MAKDTRVTVRLDDKEKAILERFCMVNEKSKSEMLRMILRYCYKINKDVCKHKNGG